MVHRSAAVATPGNFLEMKISRPTQTYGVEAEGKGDSGDKLTRVKPSWFEADP